MVWDSKLACEKSCIYYCAMGTFSAKVATVIFYPTITSATIKQ